MVSLGTKAYSGAYAPKMGKENYIEACLDIDSGVYAPNVVVIFSVLFVFLFPLLWKAFHKEGESLGKKK